jgi:hypothetical protein
MKNKNNNINNILQNTKENNFEFDIKKWVIPDFTKLDDNISEIKSSFDKFINKQKLNEQNEFDNVLQSIIKSNFNNLLDNLIPSFGNDFFDRIIFYNKNFKINSLYNNLIWGLNETLSYYIKIYHLNSIYSLTKDVKLKIYSSNDLEQIINKKNKEILELLNIKIKKFIEDSKNILIKKYISFY